jgi:hypothetical protein
VDTKTERHLQDISCDDERTRNLAALERVRKLVTSAGDEYVDPRSRTFENAEADGEETGPWDVELIKARDILYSRVSESPVPCAAYETLVAILETNHAHSLEVQACAEAFLLGWYLRAVIAEEKDNPLPPAQAGK